MTIDSAALVAIDKAWLDARENSEIDPGIMDKLDKIGRSYGEQIINNIIITNMILIVENHNMKS